MYIASHRTVGLLDRRKSERGPYSSASDRPGKRCITVQIRVFCALVTVSYCKLHWRCICPRWRWDLHCRFGWVSAAMGLFSDRVGLDKLYVSLIRRRFSRLRKKDISTPRAYPIIGFKPTATTTDKLIIHCVRYVIIYRKSFQQHLIAPYPGHRSDCGRIVPPVPSQL